MGKEMATPLLAGRGEIDGASLTALRAINAGAGPKNELWHGEQKDRRRRTTTRRY